MTTTALPQLNTSTAREIPVWEASIQIYGEFLSCGCCRGPEEDRCCCPIHQDTPRGLRPHKCSRHK